MHVETAMAAVSALLFVVTAVRPDWIEATLGLDPDGGSGALEWLIAAGLLAVALVSGGLALRSRRALAA
jgi:hypothetical protein